MIGKSGNNVYSQNCGKNYMRACMNADFPGGASGKELPLEM